MPMQPALDRNTLDRLIDLGRRQGQVTTADLRANLPVGTMSAEDIALIVLSLEEAGIAVELEDSLLTQDPKPAATRAGNAEIIPFPARPASPPKGKIGSGSVEAAMIMLPGVKAPEPKSGLLAHGAVAASLIVLAIAGILCLVWVA